MSDYEIVIHPNLFDDVKTKRLMKKVGADGVFMLLRLWAYAARRSEHTSGNGIEYDDVNDIEIILEDDENAAELIKEAVNADFISLDEECGTHFCYFNVPDLIRLQPVDDGV